MKLLPILLLNLATVGAAIVVYDQLQDDPAPRDEVVDGSVDTSALERRLDVLEARRPQLESKKGVDAGILERLELLESAGTTPAPAADGAVQPSGDARPAMKSDEPFSKGEDWKPTDEDVQRFRALRKAVERDDRIKKNAQRVNATLKKLALNLNEKQRAGITAAFTDFQPRIRQIWTDVKTEAQATIAAGGTVDRGEIVSSTTALIQQEFAATLTDVVSHADAEAVAGSLMAGSK